MESEIIEKAKELIQPINFEPNYTGYFVLMNGDDLGGSDYCKSCIKDAVKEARKWHKEQRAEIISKHDKAQAILIKVAEEIIKKLS